MPSQKRFHTPSHYLRASRRTLIGRGMQAGLTSRAGIATRHHTRPPRHRRQLLLITYDGKHQPRAYACQQRHLSSTRRVRRAAPHRASPRQEHGQTMTELASLRRYERESVIVSMQKFELTDYRMPAIYRAISLKMLLLTTTSRKSGRHDRTTRTRILFLCHAIYRQRAPTLCYR